MPPKKKVKLNESPETNLISTALELHLLLESVRNFKTQIVCGSMTYEVSSATSSFFLKHISLCLCQIQSYFFFLLKLRTSLAYNHS